MNDSTTRGTLADFITEHHITASADYADANPNMDDPRGDMRHWRVTLKAGRKRLTIPFSQGSAHTKEPTAADVLSCLASDAAGYANAQSFEDWCAEYGDNPDSRKAERTFRIVGKQADKLQAFLGVDAYEQLLWNTEQD